MSEFPEAWIHKTISVAIPKLHPSKYNPRHITPKEFRKLKASIRKFGFVEPIVIQKKGMNIIGGHQRIKAVIDICKEDGYDLPKIPAVILNVSDRKAKMMNLALNKIGGDFKQDMLNTLIRDLNDDRELRVDEVESMGYELKEIESMIASADTMMDGDSEDSDLQPFASSVTLSVKFDSVEERDSVKAILAEKSSKANVKPGTILHRVLVAKKKKSPRKPL